jgi:uncharacterized lipoprotein NlpE involved in copper resistance
MYQVRQVFKYALWAVIILLFLMGCDNRPYRLPYLDAQGRIIGRENCTANAEDAWLIGIIESDSRNPAGSAIFYKGKSYNKVVRSYGLDLTVQALDSNQIYLFEYLYTDKTTPDCTVQNPETYKIPTIHIKGILNRF